MEISEISINEVKSKISLLPIKKVEIGSLHRSRDVQPRVHPSEKTIAEYQGIYQEAWESGNGDPQKCWEKLRDAMDPLVAFEVPSQGSNGSTLFLTSGFTRLKALERLYNDLENRKVATLGSFAPVRVLQGMSETWAVIYASSANSEFFGERMTAADAANAVKNILRISKGLSINAIHAIVGTKAISRATIGRIKKGLEESGQVEIGDTVISINGTPAKRKPSPGKQEPPTKPEAPSTLAPLAENLKQANGKPVPKDMADIFGDETIQWAIRSFEEISVAMSPSVVRAHRHVRPVVFLRLGELVDELRGSLPAIVCPTCRGQGCETCDSSGHIPHRDFI